MSSALKFVFDAGLLVHETRVWSDTHMRDKINAVFMLAVREVHSQTEGDVRASHTELLPLP
jgi:hypothetical protein